MKTIMCHVRVSFGGTCVGEEGRKRRLGFGKKGKSSFTVHRSEEVLPDDTSGGRSGRQPSSASSDGEGSGDGDRYLDQTRETSQQGTIILKEDLIVAYMK
ncbi:hypothetical protein PV326_013616, partial [Microctonus aethiopoides]